MTPSGISTTGLGLETPDMIELRKRKTQIESDTESSAGGDTPALYKILPEESAHVGASMMGSSKVYDVSHAKKALAHAEINADEMEVEGDSLHFDKAKAKGKAKAQQKPPLNAPHAPAEKDKNKKYKEFKFWGHLSFQSGILFFFSIIAFYYLFF